MFNIVTNFTLTLYVAHWCQHTRLDKHILIVECLLNSNIFINTQVRCRVNGVESTWTMSYDHCRHNTILTIVPGTYVAVLSISDVTV